MSDPVDRRRVPVRRSAHRGGGVGSSDDWVIVEEPLEILVDDEPTMITMRTPGSDVELALGFCYAEGLITRLSDVESVEPVEHENVGSEQGDRIAVRLTDEGRARLVDLERVARLFPASSACGICGRLSLEDLWQRIPAIRPLDLRERELIDLIASLREPLRAQQPSFAETGGCHAAALFDLDRRCLAAFEDVGRHNAVDKLVGSCFGKDELPLADRILVTSGRAGFEIVQKAATAGVPVVAALGAASSLAIEMAHFAGVTLFSFVAGEAMNLHRMRGDSVEK